MSPCSFLWSVRKSNVAPWACDAVAFTLWEVETCIYRQELLRTALCVTCASSSPGKSAPTETGEVKHCCLLPVQQKDEDHDFFYMFPALLNCIPLSETLQLHPTVEL